MRVHEGGVELEVPDQPEEGAGDAVFFNPVQELNRDLTVAVLRAYRERNPEADTYCDATTATGVRGVRAAADGWTVTCCDVDSDATALAAENLARNDLDGETVTRDANLVLHDRAFDIVDVDPFGTPVPFADAAFRGTGELLCVTATDLAPLCGAHFNSGVRSYSAVPRNTEYHSEMGVRILLSALARTAARYDVAVDPLCTHASAHYVRTYLALDRGAQVADATLDRLGHIYHCPACLWRETERGLTADPPDGCDNCGATVETAGPVWLDRTADGDFLDATAASVPDGFGTAEKARDLLGTLADELATPTHYDQHRLCKLWGRPATAMDDFLEALRTAGHDASRTHYGGTTFKTTASVGAVRAVTGDSS
ncbi:MAG: tRNA (guanine26-N2/guanine27-N2)-dimethyltransferase [Natronomonas sp.]|jgi:tRNA (guanine26-N2/guanine27-N2)-dimethyltransferase